ncbi:MAG: hypothetical protein M3A44_04095 [Gammaproteobacteria bacterium]
MKRFLIAAAVATATVSLAIPSLAADVGVSISIGQPGFYGRIDIGDYPRPQVIYRQPIIIERAPMYRPPIYLRVPPGHAKHWRRHCHEYNACGEQVFFVRDEWYSREYVPRYQERYRDRRDGGRGEHRNDNREQHRNDRHGNDRDHGRDHHGRDD